MLLADLGAIEDKSTVLATQCGGHKFRALRLERFDSGGPGVQGDRLIRSGKYFRSETERERLAVNRSLREAVATPAFRVKAAGINEFHTRDRIFGRAISILGDPWQGRAIGGNRSH